MTCVDVEHKNAKDKQRSVQGKWKKIRSKCGFKTGIDVSAEGTRGGLSFGWNGDLVVNLKSFSKAHIDIEVVVERGDDYCRFTWFYGSLIENLRKESWKLIKKFKEASNLPWLVLGDFSEIVYTFEKNGGQAREERQMTVFREVLDECELSDLGFSGRWFIWEKRRLPENNIRER
ncbi:hypothetical protein J1N35_028370 [Gossypium stocksii]|uniref:Endonuclease/exonuclease/phosphatase domain-containing protein n=1 Tax=Gossypium stocksii TaxID=47602 RepID=A0A9D3ZS19_9ROSI|nr:hypothetical protein J1N35_028370 [Gossypium stocksii]